MLRAYDDSDGRAPSLTKHALVALAETRGGRVDLEAFEHRAVWNREQSRVELHLVSRVAQQLSVAGERFMLAASEPIVVGVACSPRCAACSWPRGWPRQVFTAQAQPMRLWLCEPRGA